MSEKHRKVSLHIGMLWYDKDAKSADEMIIGAAAYYFAKYGIVPERCHVHPDTFKKKKIVTDTGEMIIVADKTVQKNHVWIGVVR